MIVWGVYSFDYLLTSMHRSLNLRNVLIISIPFLFIFNEYLIYYLWIFNCNWPDEGDTKVMIFADTHLLGVLNGHWFDKLRRLVFIR